MSEQITNITKNIVDFWKNLSKKIKMLVIFAVVVVPIVSIIIAIILNRDEYTVLFPNMDSSEAVEVIKILQESNVNYKYEENGQILIPKDQEAMLVMQLSQQGHPRTGLNYDVFKDNIDFMTTDYEKRTYMVFQLQERLQSSIKTISGVKDAIVTITLPEDKKYAWDSSTQEASASAMINLMNGVELNSSQISGITQLICKSIPGLKEENISIVDSNGNSLSVDDGMIHTDIVKLRLQIQKEFESDLEKSVESFLSRIYGSENVEVSAKCTMNFDKKIGETLQYVPDDNTSKGVIQNSQNNIEIVGEGTASGGVAGTESNSEIPTYPEVTINGDDIYFKDNSSVNYVVGQIKEQIQYESGNIDDLSIAVVINKEKMSTDEINSVKQLIANSSGIDIEKVALHNMDFYNPDIPAFAPEVSKETIDINKILLIGLGLLIVIIILITVLIIYYKRKKRKNKVNLVTNIEQPKEETWADIKDEIELQETKEKVLKKKIKEFSNSNPEIAAQLLRTWLKGDDE